MNKLLDNSFGLTYFNRLIIYIIPFNIIFDFLSIYYSGRGSTLAIIRALVLLLFYFSTFKDIKRSNLLNSVLLFIIYISIIIPFSSETLYSINVSSKIFLTLLLLPISYSLIQSKQAMDLLNSKILNSYLLIVAGFAIYNFFNVGGYVYTEEETFDVGGMADSWNTLTYLLLLTPFYINQNKDAKNKFIFFMLYISILIILIISFKRIAILGFILGNLIYFYKSGRIKTAIKGFLVVSILQILLLPLFSDLLLVKYQVRQDRFSPELYESEARYMETIYTWEEMLSFQDQFKSLFGGEAFNSIGNYAGGLFGRRQAHVDYNLILITNGFVGLFLYLNIYYSMFRSYRRSVKKIPINQRKNVSIYIALFWTLFLTSLFTSFGGQMYQVTFRSIIFLYLGAVLGVLNRLHVMSES